VNTLADSPTSSFAAASSVNRSTPFWSAEQVIELTRAFLNMYVEAEYPSSDSPWRKRPSRGASTDQTSNTPWWRPSLLRRLNKPPGWDTVFTASGDRVVVEGTNAGSVVETGERYEHDWVMVLTIQDGKVVRFRHYYDPGDIETAMGE
jgi:ketosteroid isomerase-like protein